MQRYQRQKDISESDAKPKAQKCNILLKEKRSPPHLLTLPLAAKKDNNLKTQIAQVWLITRRLKLTSLTEDTGTLWKGQVGVPMFQGIGCLSICIETGYSQIETISVLSKICKDRLEICEQIYTTRFLGQKFYTLKVCKLRWFLLKKELRKCINISYFSRFFVRI